MLNNLINTILSDVLSAPRGKNGSNVVPLSAIQQNKTGKPAPFFHNLLSKIKLADEARADKNATTLLNETAQRKSSKANHLAVKSKVEVILENMTHTGLIPSSKPTITGIAFSKITAQPNGANSKTANKLPHNIREVLTMAGGVSAGITSAKISQASSPLASSNLDVVESKSASAGLTIPKVVSPTITGNQPDVVTGLKSQEFITTQVKKGSIDDSNSLKPLIRTNMSEVPAGSRDRMPEKVPTQAAQANDRTAEKFRSPETPVANSNPDKKTTHTGLKLGTESNASVTPGKESKSVSSADTHAQELRSSSGKQPDRQSVLAYQKIAAGHIHNKIKSNVSLTGNPGKSSPDTTQPVTTNNRNIRTGQESFGESQNSSTKNNKFKNSSEPQTLQSPFTVKLTTTNQNSVKQVAVPANNTKATINHAELVHSIRYTLSSGKSDLVLRLRPEVLGRALITLHHSKGALHLNFQVQEPAARVAIEAEATRLKDTLVNAGFGNVTIDVKSGDGQTRQDNFTFDDAKDRQPSSGNPQHQEPEPKQDTTSPEKQLMLGYNTFELVA